MKNLVKHSALASALLLTAISAHAESLSFEVTDSDTIVVGATSEKVTLKVTGFKNMKSMSNAPAGTQLGTFAMSTSESNGQVAIAYSTEHSSQVVSNLLTGQIENEEGHKINTNLSMVTGSTILNVNGTDWLLPPKANGTSVDGQIVTNGITNLNPGVYPVTLRAALYIP